MVECDETCHAHPDRVAVAYQINGAEKLPVCARCVETNAGEPPYTDCGGDGCQTCEQLGTRIAQLRYGGM